MSAARCRTCDARLFPCHRWRCLSPEQRAALRADGYRQGTAEAECTTCRRRATKPGARSAAELAAERQAADELLAHEWNHLADVCWSDWENADVLAPRLGLTPDGLVNAVERLRAKGLVPYRRRGFAVVA